MSLVKKNSPLEPYKIIGNQVFTAENFVTYSIRVDCSLYVTTLMIKNHFQNYGRIVNVRFVKGHSKWRKIYFVYFANPRDALKALLREKSKSFMVNEFNVRPNDSLYQPDGERFIKRLNPSLEMNSSIETCQEALILNYNDDCLENVCKMLSTNDRINFALSCRRFWNVFVMMSKIEYACLHTTDVFADMTLFKIRIFLQVVGPKIKTLVIDRLYNHNFFWKLEKLCGKFCVNVKSLKVLDALHRKDQLITLTKRMPLLQELELCDLKFNAGFLEHLIKFKDLKFLSITTKSNTTIENIEVLCNLEKLSLKGCSNLSSLSFRHICKKLKNLIDLDIRFCDQLIIQDYEYIAKHLLQLKSLKISGCDEDLSCLTQLPNLMQLEIDQSTRMPDNFYNNLAKYKGNQLEELRLNISNMNMTNVSSIAELKKLKVIYCRCDNLLSKALNKFSHLTELEEINLKHFHTINDEGILLLLEKCLKLKSISLDFCEGITTQFVRSAHELIQQQRCHLQRNARVELNLVTRDVSLYSYYDNNRFTGNGLNLTCIQHPSYDDSDSEE